MEALLGLLAASFAAATLLPLPSEAALFAYLQVHLAFMAAGRLARYIVVASLA